MAPGPAAAQGGREPGPAPVWEEEGRLPPEQRREREREEGREDQMGEDETLERRFCKYLPVWQHMACLVSFGRLRGAFGTSDETLNRV